MLSTTVQVTASYKGKVLETFFSAFGQIYISRVGYTLGVYFQSFKEHFVICHCYGKLGNGYHSRERVFAQAYTMGP